MTPRSAVVLLVVLALGVLGASVALAQELAGPHAPPPAPLPAATTTPTPLPDAPPAAPEERPLTDTPIRWHESRALGRPHAGRLAGGVELPEGGRDFFTWDSARKVTPSRAWRRWGTDELIVTVLDVLSEYRQAHPDAPRVGIGDLSRPKGGQFGARYGGLGHVSHQNGLDVDLYYPRTDRLERRPASPKLVDRALAQDLVDRFVAAGAQHVFVGPSLALGGPRKVVSPLVHHDDHLHVRIRPARRGGRASRKVPPMGLERPRPRPRSRPASDPGPH